ncbi:glucose 1-dehydrogenase [Alkalicoccus saliphilus]|uniref:3-ketoacyl-ACP reductase n=1 Tax=Alkalicoccus saliphilus TaxID=200989 RepID=A0A2T4U2W2_9BACI|nr:glucose 1-dehydrogenase [Alkalicoccus saliphilus]PTL37738.1 3-ketoacyl-ACP reductase [Alkalicoccus saliphilus]
MKLEGKTAVITGAGSGMGRAAAILFAKEGANVVAADMNEETVREVAEEIKGLGKEAKAVQVNVTKQEDVEKMVQEAVDSYGSIDVLVNNAGVMDNFIPVGDVTNEQWDKVMKVNVTGPMMAMRAALKHMMSQKSGVIVNNASVGGLFGARGGSAYVASKHALLGMTKNTAAVYSTDYGIRCNAVAPGAVQTNIGSTIDNPNPLGGKAIAKAGEPPLGQAEEIASVMLFLASEDSSFINGAVVTADGGWTAV